MNMVDEGLQIRIEEQLAEIGVAATVKRMFGGLCFLDRGNMLCGITKDGELMVRVGKERYEVALAREHAREMDFTGRSLKGMVYVAAEGVDDDEDLRSWLAMASSFTGSLPSK